MTSDTIPAVINQYFAAADAKDPRGLAACFTPTGTVLDEGVTYRGLDEIVAWREALLGKWEFTSTVMSTEPVGDAELLAAVHVEGNFPGGQADLRYRFVLDDGMIAALSIVG